MTNFHLKNLPLYQQDQSYCARVRNRLRFIFNEIDEDPERQQENYVLVDFSIGGL